MRWLFATDCSRGTLIGCVQPQLHPVTGTVEWHPSGRARSLSLSRTLSLFLSLGDVRLPVGQSQCFVPSAVSLSLLFPPAAVSYHTPVSLRSLHTIGMPHVSKKSTNVECNLKRERGYRWMSSPTLPSWPRVGAAHHDQSSLSSLG